MREDLTISTSKKQEMLDITRDVNKIIKKSGIKNGICNIFITHATAAIVINENYDPNICLDLLDSLNKNIPQGIWRHDKIDGNADSHIKSSILGPGETVPIENGKLLLGRWQSLMITELDGPRERTIIITTIGD